MPCFLASCRVFCRSLEGNAYDHIAATYYLMAEAHLRKKEDIENNPMNHLDLERLDRRRQRVRKLSTPGSPARFPGPDFPTRYVCVCVCVCVCAVVLGHTNPSLL